MKLPQSRLSLRAQVSAVVFSAVVAHMIGR
jgi:hypothetical protein